MDELKACPFCGKAASSVEEYRAVSCTYCGAKMKYDFDPKKRLASKAWNTRTPSLPDEMQKAVRHEAILFCAEIMYRKDNPDSKMDIPSIAYEHIEKQYDKWKRAKK